MKRTVTILKDERRITLFRVPKGSRVRHQQLGDGVTVLGDGDVLVMPSRRRDTEAKCHFAEGRAPGEVDVAAAPEVASRLCYKRRASRGRASPSSSYSGYARHQDRRRGVP